MRQGYMAHKFLFFLCLFFSNGFLSAQVFWTEDFGTGCSRGNLATSYTGINGAWTLTNGTNDNFANQWFVSATEAGLAPGNCGDGCNTNGSLTDRTLHVGNVSIAAANVAADTSAKYHPGGTCAFMVCVATDRRAESPTINCTGQSNITLSFNYIEGGNAIDHAVLDYFDGTNWTTIDSLAKTVVCGTGVGTWTAFTIALPATANNNPNVKIGFHWVNNDDGVGTDPSFAVDDIELSVSTAPPGVNFVANDSLICENTCINFSDLSTNGPTSWSWTFTGGTPATSTAQNPTGICYSTAGVYDVKLVATNASGTDSLTKSLYIDVTTCTAPVASFFASDSVICVNSCIDFSDSSQGNPSSWQWTFTGAFPASSSLQHPQTICYGSPGVYNVQLIVDNGNGTDTLVKTITVNACAVPVANFSASDSTLCLGNCIDFTDLTAGGPTSWEWSFPGATPSSSFAQNPTGICYTSVGTYPVTLIATNNLGSDTLIQTNFITVTNCVPPTASFSAGNTSFCANTCINFTDLSAGNPTSWNWSFVGGTPAASNQQNPTGICYNTPGTYDVSLTASNAYGSHTTVLTGYITVNECLPPIAGFTSDSIEICVDGCINFQDTSLNGPTSWSWSFPGSLTPSSNQKNPANICYPNAGTYTVSLIAQNSLGADTEIRTGYITVLNCVPPVPSFTIPDTICQSTCVYPENNSINAYSYEWLAPGAIPPTSTDSTPFFCFPDSGNFIITLIAHNPWGSDTLDQTIRVDSMPVIYTIPQGDTTIALGSTIQLDFTPPHGGLPQFWTPIGTLNCDTCKAPIARPLIDTEYIVHWADSNGCYGTDTIMVRVEQMNVAVLPDAFSPNGDGENDFLYLRGNSIREMNLKVYDRYGQLMFETTSQDDGWSGQYNGFPVNSGVYFWHFDVAFEDGERRTEKGRILLVR